MTIYLYACLFLRIMPFKNIKDLFFFFDRGNEGIEAAIKIIRDQISTKRGNSDQLKQIIIEEMDKIEILTNPSPNNELLTTTALEYSERMMHLGKYANFSGHDAFDKYYSHLAVIYSHCFKEPLAKAMVKTYFDKELREEDEVTKNVFDDLTASSEDKCPF